MENLTQNNKKKHSISMKNRSDLVIEGVRSVPTFSEKTVVVELEEETLIIDGENLDIKSLDTDSGKAKIDGKVSSIRYGVIKNQMSLLKKVFK